MTDDYDQEYLTLDAKHVEILDETGRDRTGEFNIQDKDGCSTPSPGPLTP